MNVYLNCRRRSSQFGGTIDKFVGDGFMAIFEGRGNEINAVRAAWRSRLLQRIKCGTVGVRGKNDQHRHRLNNGEVVMVTWVRRSYDYTVIATTSICCTNVRIAQPEWCWPARRSEAIGDQASLKDQHPVM